jgi:hypothetical protein
MDVLFVTRDDVLRYTSIGGNVDVDKLIPHIKVAQDTYLTSLLGTKLYQRIEQVVSTNETSGDYYDLLMDFIQPCVIHYATAEFLTFHAYSISNGGVFRHISDNSTTPDLDEVKMLVQKCRDNADHYRRRFIDHVCYYNSRYPEYTASQEDGQYPSYNENTTRWVL